MEESSIARYHKLLNVHKHITVEAQAQYLEHPRTCAQFSQQNPTNALQTPLNSIRPGYARS